MPRPRRNAIAYATILLALLLLPCESHASDDGLEAVELKIGQPAPFDGQLFSPELAEELVLAADEVDERVAIEKRRLERTCKFEMAYLRKLGEISNEAARSREVALKKALDARLAWYRQPEFVAVISFAATLVLVRVVGEAQ